MGIISKAIPGGFSGKPGTVTGDNWKGTAYMRSKPVSQRTRFSNSQAGAAGKIQNAHGLFNYHGPMLKSNLP